MGRVSCRLQFALPLRFRTTLVLTTCYVMMHVFQEITKDLIPTILCENIFIRETRSPSKDLFAFRYPIILRFSGLWFSNPCLSFKIVRDVQMRIMSGMSHKGLKLYMYYDEEIHFAFSLLVAVLINTISNVITSRLHRETTKGGNRISPIVYPSSKIPSTGKLPRI